MSLVHHGIESSSVAWISNEKWQVSLHALLGQVVHAVELVPELRLEWLSCLKVELNSVQAECVHHTHGGLIALIVSQVVELASLGHDPNVKAWSRLHTDEFLECVSISLANLTSINSLCESKVEGVVSVVLPNTLEVWLG